MSDGPQPGMPFGAGGFDINELLRMLRGEGPLNFDVARQVSSWVAAQGQPEPPVDASVATMLDDLARTAHLHVVEATGLGAELGPVVRCQSRVEWAHTTLDALRPVLTLLAERMAAGPGGPDVGEEFGPGEADIAGLLTAMAPLLLGVQAGFMIGHLATHTLSRYEMPLPLEADPAVVFVTPNVVAFENDWSLPPEEHRFYLALNEVAHAAVLSVPWVRERLLRLGLDFVGAFEVDPSAVQSQLGDFNPMDPSTFESAMSDPAEFLGAIRTGAQREALARLTLTTAVVEGYVDFVVEQTGRRLISEFDRIREAAHRNRLERGEAARFLEALLGFQLSRDDYERASAFCAGVVERAGPEALSRLWEDESMLPTPPEWEAPGLWLARIELPPDDTDEAGDTDQA